MKASARKRAEGLALLLADAQRQADALRAEIAGHEADAHGAYVRGDPGAGDASHEKAASLKPLLADLESKVQTLGHAARVLSEQQAREALETRRETVRMALAEAVSEMHVMLAEVRPGLAAIRASLRQAAASEDRARRLENELEEIKAGLGEGERRRFFTKTNDVSAMVESSRLLTDLMNSTDF